MTKKTEPQELSTESDAPKDAATKAPVTKAPVTKDAAKKDTGKKVTLTKPDAVKAGTTDDTEASAPDTAPGRLSRIRSGITREKLRGRAVPAAVAAAMVASVATAGTLYFTMYRDDQATGTDAGRDVIDAANKGTVALLSYSPAHLDADFAGAKDHLTGQFLTYYNEFTTKVVKPAAVQNGIDTKATIVRSAVSELSKDNAVVLAFVNQATTSKTKPEPELTSSSVRVSLQHVDGNWLISSFDPV